MCTERSLMWFNGVTAALHGVWALLLIVLRAVNGYEDSVAPLTRYYSSWTVADAQCEMPANCTGCRVEPFEFSPPDENVTFVVQEARLDAGVGLSVHWLVVGFFLLSFAFQMFTALPFTQGMYGQLTGTAGYMDAVKQGRQPIRFLEYAVSAAIMLVLIALENGVRDMGMLWCIGALTTATQVLGLVSEDYRVRKDYMMMWCTHLTGWCAQGVAVGAIVARFVDSGGLGGEHCNGNNEPPSFVKWTVFGQFALFSLFGVTQLAQNCVAGRYDALDDQDKVCGPIYFETMYVLQSLVSKSLLCFTLYFPIFLQLELP